MKSIFSVAPGTKLSDHIIIGTPGKVLDWGLKYRVIDLKKIRVFVLDEADVMIATQGHHDQCIRIHKYVERIIIVHLLQTKFKKFQCFADNFLQNVKCCSFLQHMTRR